MLSLHQLRCFLVTYELGSLTAAAEELGYAQPSISEQIRALEKSLDAQLFQRVGRGVTPTAVADALRPHAERTLAAAEDARQAVRSVSSLETGTIRFGMFGTARLYAGAGLVADVLARHPGVRVELVGQNSTDVEEEIRRGRIEAAMIAIASVQSEGMEVTPVCHDELVYVSADPERTASPVTPQRLARASLVMSETTWRATDSTRTILRQMLHETGLNPVTRIEVEDVETAVELVGMGLADSVIPKGAAMQLLPRLAPQAGWTSLRPRQFDSLAIVHRAGAALSPATRLMIELATARIRTVIDEADIAMPRRKQRR
ncbi:DNA-binding transcriptional LysR family regulator [Nocardioides massiliensis]|uniref:DNA-binding transcriptional LysR family regulator n=3 Tax=Nocardioides massiliensis TaxID=1325935 RepID=A0ABT9NKI1_9ACTN|nr:LysR family transcriptional regulator [Nocardioides massiliensis]MDP9820926.1 DNA-binding transcriptional LysR family regulator [Nocardioides massiliensis]